jgi:hypothetical protein
MNSCRDCGWAAWPTQSLDETDLNTPRPFRTAGKCHAPQAHCTPTITHGGGYYKELNWNAPWLECPLWRLTDEEHAKDLQRADMKYSNKMSNLKEFMSLVKDLCQDQGGSQGKTVRVTHQRQVEDIEEAAKDVIHDNPGMGRV